MLMQTGVSALRRKFGRATVGTARARKPLTSLAQFNVMGRLRRLGWLGLWLLADYSLHAWLNDPSAAGSKGVSRYHADLGIPTDI